jgi:hypothetical protein
MAWTVTDLSPRCADGERFAKANVQATGRVDQVSPARPFERRGGSGNRAELDGPGQLLHPGNCCVPIGSLALLRHIAGSNAGMCLRQHQARGLERPPVELVFEPVDMRAGSIHGIVDWHNPPNWTGGKPDSIVHPLDKGTDINGEVDFPEPPQIAQFVGDQGFRFDRARRREGPATWVPTASQRSTPGVRLKRRVSPRSS